MRKSIMALACLLLSGGGVWAQAQEAAKEPTQAERDAADAVVKDFQETHAAHHKELPPSAEPPFDLVAVMTGSPELDADTDKCGQLAAGLMDCMIAVQRRQAQAQALRDMDLQDAFEQVERRMGQALDKGLVTRDQVRFAYGALSGAYGDAMGELYVGWLAGLTRQADLPPYDYARIAAAQEQADRALTVCGLGRTSSVSLMDCLIDNDRAFARNIAMRDMTMFDAAAKVLTRAAAATDAGTLTREKLLGLYKSLNTFYRNASDRNYQTYLDRHYRAAAARAYGKAAPPAGAPLDSAKVDAAIQALAAALNKCPAEAGKDGVTAAGWMGCRVAALEDFAAGVALADKARLKAATTTMRLAVADADAGRLPVAMMPHVYSTLYKDFGDIVMAAHRAQMAAARQPIIDRYVAMLDQKNAAAPQAPDLSFDAAAAGAADAARKAAQDACNAAPNRTVMGDVECFLAAERGYAVSTKALDQGLFEAFGDTLRALAADITAGTVSTADSSSVYEAVQQHYYKLWQDKVGQADTRRAAALYVARYEQEYAAATAKRGKPADRPAYDDKAVEAATAARVKSITACTDGVPPPAVFAACLNDAERVYAKAIALNDMALNDAAAATLQFLAAEMGAGRLTRPQFEAAFWALENEYAARAEKQQDAWNAAHPANGQ